MVFSGKNLYPQNSFTHLESASRLRQGCAFKAAVTPDHDIDPRANSPIDSIFERTTGPVSSYILFSIHLWRSLIRLFCEPGITIYPILSSKMNWYVVSLPIAARSAATEILSICSLT